MVGVLGGCESSLQEMGVCVALRSVLPLERGFHQLLFTGKILDEGLVEMGMEVTVWDFGCLIERGLGKVTKWSLRSLGS